MNPRKNKKTRGVLVRIGIGVLSVLAPPAGAVVTPASPVEEVDKPFVYNDHGKRDPFLRLVNAQGMIISLERDDGVKDPEVSRGNFHLEGIISEDTGSVAMINGEILRVGDILDSYVVEEISPQTVVLKKGEERLKLELTKEE